MTRAPVEPSDERTCYRCDRSLTDGHWIRLSAEHGGRCANAFEDVSRHLCGDCAAGIGMLEICRSVFEGARTDSGAARDPIKSRR
ncbi:hypothetical protein [Halovivax limisalsi]|uniref:hypothetical protein n=1 Tax=Halovivax limisalsi TaxID=1453760 RepID=UPI001FFCD4B3|nr:hypothetical protein [Halovivax limisalsi]